MISLYENQRIWALNMHYRLLALRVRSGIAHAAETVIDETQSLLQTTTDAAPAGIAPNAT